MGCAECQINCTIGNKIKEEWDRINSEHKDALEKFPENKNAISANTAKQIKELDEILEAIDTPEGCLLKNS